jgi:hypothetical protein
MKSKREQSAVIKWNKWQEKGGASGGVAIDNWIERSAIEE